VKILESFVGRWIFDKIGPKLDNNQFGALRGRSTSHALVSILNTWCNALDAGQSVRALFVDFSKAFDRVDHTLLLNKLSNYGVPVALVKWVFSFLKDRQQRVKIGNSFSDWANLVAGYPQGTWSGPLAYITLIDDLRLLCLVHKFVDDTTLTEILPSVTTPSRMVQFADELLNWATENFMLINYKKTKEMILGSLRNHSLPALTIGGNDIERVTCFKLLGVNLSDDLRWEEHIETICTKVSSRLYFLKQLKRSGLSTDDLKCVYTTLIRPVLEYASVVWHHGLTQAQSEQLEALQKRAIRIIYGRVVVNMPYSNALYYSDLESLRQRRASLGQTFYDQITQPSNCLHNLLPPRRDPAIISRLRHAMPYEMPRVRTDRYCSYINYALAHYQTLT
jgi:hypothetical protein